VRKSVPILNLDLLEKQEAALKAWDEENEDRHFSLWRWCRFAIMSGGAPYVVEEPYLGMWKEIASGKTKRKLELLPRGAAKSYQLKTFICFLLADFKSHRWGPQVRIPVCGQTKPFATRTSESARQMLSTNSWIIQEFGELQPTKEVLKEWKELADRQGVVAKPSWRKAHFRTMPCVRAEIDSGVVLEEPSCWAIGMDEASTGMHFDVAVVDDPVGLSSYKSPVKKEKARALYYDLQSQMMDGLIVVLGTRWATDDLHATILSEYFRTHAITCKNVWGNGKEYTQDDFHFDEETGIFEPHFDPDEAVFFYDGYGCIEDEVRQGYRYEPKERRRRTLQFICDKLFHVPTSVWQKQYLNRAISAEDLVFHEWMFKTVPAEKVPSDLNHYILTDSATGKDARSSYRVVVVVGLDSNDCAYVRDVQFGLWAPKEYMGRVIEARDRYNPKSVLMEQVAWQDAFRAVGDLMCEQMGTRKLHVTAVQGRSLVSKFERIERLEPRLRANKLVFEERIKTLEADNKNVWKEMVKQFLDCRDEETSKGLRIDIPDAISDLETCDRDGIRYCKPSRVRRSQKELSAVEEMRSSHAAARNDNRGFRTGPARGSIKRPRGWGRTGTT